MYWSWPLHPSTHLHTDWWQAICVSLDTLLHPEIWGLDEAIVIGSQPEITCIAEYCISETVRFTWSIANRKLSSDMQEIIEYDNNTARFVSVLNYNLTRDDDTKNVTCSVTTRRKENRIEADVTKTAHLLCEYFITYFGRAHSCTNNVQYIRTVSC